MYDKKYVPTKTLAKVCRSLDFLCFETSLSLTKGLMKPI